MDSEANVMSASTNEPDLLPTTERRSPKMKGRISEYSVSFVVSLMCIVAGFVIEWFKPMLEHTKSSDMTIDLTLLALTPAIVSTVCSILMYWIVKTYGRKPGFYVAGVCGTVSGGLFVLLDEEVMCEYTARVFSSVCMMAATMICPLYMIELVHDSTRGFFTSACVFYCYSGLAIASYIGEKLSFSAFCALLFILPASFLFLIFWFPESPFFLVSKSKMTEAERSLTWMRGQSPVQVKQELTDITAMISPIQTDSKSWWSDTCIKKGFIIAISFSIIRSIGGINLILAHVCDLFNDNNSTDKREAVMIVVNLLCISTFLGSLAADRAGRKLMLYISFGGSSMSFFVIFAGLLINAKSFPFIPVCSCIFVIFFGIGYGSIAETISLEVTPAAMRCQMMAMSIAVRAVLDASIQYSFEHIKTTIGDPLNYLIPTVGNAIGLWFTWMVVPETSHKSLKDIQLALGRERSQLITPVQH